VLGKPIVTFEPENVASDENHVKEAAVLNPTQDAVRLILGVSHVIVLVPLLFVIVIDCALDTKTARIKNASSGVLIILRIR
jgi:hypothetical protein